MSIKYVDTDAKTKSLVEEEFNDNYRLYIKDLIENNSILLEQNQNEFMTVLSGSILEKYSEQWKYNRVLNMDKVKEIIDIIKKSKRTILDTTIQCFYIQNEDKIIVFDGNHRREALILLWKLEKIDIKVCCFIYKKKGDGDSIYVDKEIAKKFKMINQNTPIPEIYMDIIDDTEDTFLNKRKSIIEETFDYYKTKYKKFYSISSSCKRPNFNDTKFKDLCNSLEFKSVEELKIQLDELNDKNKLLIDSKKASEMMKSKCNTNNFYLFV